MFQSLLVPHQEITHTQLNEIIQIKSIAWPYSYEKQLEWIHCNLKNTDIHVLLYQEETLVAYLNLIEIEFKIDGNLKSGYGIGNVCAKEKGKGYGSEIIKQTNQYILNKKSIGLLFCSGKLVEFYKKYNWILMDKNKLILSFRNDNIETMILNQLESFLKLQYNGNSF